MSAKEDSVPKMNAKEDSVPAAPMKEKPVYPFNKPPGPIQKPPGFVNNNQPKPKGQIYRAPFTAYRPGAHRGSKRNLCRCFCIWLSIVVLSLLLLLGIAGVILYFIYRPQEPHFSVKTLQIPRLAVTTSKSGDTTLSTQVSVKMEAMNANKALKFFYEESKVTVMRDKVSLGEGSFPAFVQVDQNTTELKISNVKAMNTAIDQLDGTNLKLMYTQKKLKLKVELDTHVRIKISKWKTGKIKIAVQCDGVPEAKTTLDESNTKCKLKLFKYKWFPFK